MKTNVLKRTLAGVLAVLCVAGTLPANVYGGGLFDTAIVARAEGTSGEWGDGINYSYDPETGTLTLTKGTGTVVKQSEIVTQLRNGDVIGINAGYENISRIVISEGITQIDSNAFANWRSGRFKKNITVEIPSTVTIIGDRAFSWITSGSLSVVMNRGPEELNIAENAFDSARDGTFTTPYTEAWKTASGCTYDSETNILTIVNNGSYGTFTLVAATLSGNCGANGNNVTYTLEDNDKDSNYDKLTIKGTGAMADYSSYTEVPWYSIKDKIKTVVIENGVTSIGNNSFYYCDNLTSVTIPGSVTSIGIAAFQYCVKLTDVSIGEGVTAIGSYMFFGCVKLKSITIPNSVTSIGNNAFHNCDRLESITIPAGVTNIGTSAFSYFGNHKSSLETVTLTPPTSCQTLAIKNATFPDNAKVAFAEGNTRLFYVNTETKTGDAADTLNNTTFTWVKPLAVGTEIYMDDSVLFGSGQYYYNWQNSDGAAGGSHTTKSDDDIVFRLNSIRLYPDPSRYEFILVGSHTDNFYINSPQFPATPAGFKVAGGTGTESDPFYFEIIPGPLEVTTSQQQVIKAGDKFKVSGDVTSIKKGDDILFCESTIPANTVFTASENNGLEITYKNGSPTNLGGWSDNSAKTYLVGYNGENKTLTFTENKVYKSGLVNGATLSFGDVLAPGAMFDQSFGHLQTNELNNNYINVGYSGVWTITANGADSSPGVGVNATHVTFADGMNAFVLTRIDGYNCYFNQTKISVAGNITKDPDITVTKDGSPLTGEGNVIKNVDGEVVFTASAPFTVESGGRKTLAQKNANGDYVVEHTMFGDATAEFVEVEITSGGETTYGKSLITAIDNATAGSTIKLLRNTSIDSAHVKAANVTLDLNGFSIEKNNLFSNNIIAVGAGASLTIEDNSADKNGTVEADIVNGGVINNNSSLTIEGGTFTGTLTLNDYSYTTIEGGTFTKTINLNHGSSTRITGGKFKDFAKDGVIVTNVSGGLYQEEPTALNIYTGKSLVPLKYTDEQPYKYAVCDFSIGTPTVLGATSKSYDGTGVTLTANHSAEKIRVDGVEYPIICTYQWSKLKDDGSGKYEDIQGATDKTYTTGAKVSDSGTYRVEVIAGSSKAFANGATVTITKASLPDLTGVIVNYNNEEQNLISGTAPEGLKFCLTEPYFAELVVVQGLYDKADAYYLAESGGAIKSYYDAAAKAIGAYAFAIVCLRDNNDPTLILNDTKRYANDAETIYNDMDPAMQNTLDSDIVNYINKYIKGATADGLRARFTTLDISSCSDTAKAKDADTYTVYYTGDGVNYDNSEVKNFTATINKVQATIYGDLAGNTLPYTGEEQELVSSSPTSIHTMGGELQYSLDGTNFSASVPKARDIGTYTVSYMVKGDKNHTDSDVKSYKVKIVPATPEVIKAPAAKNPTRYQSPVELISAGVAKNGTMYYSLGTASAPGGSWTADASSITANAAGTYYVWFYVKGLGAENTVPAKITVTVTQGKLAQAFGLEIESYEYDGTAHEAKVKGAYHDSVSIAYYNTDTGAKVYGAPSEVGNYKAVAHSEGNAYYSSRTVEVEYSITAPADSIIVRARNAYFTGLMDLVVKFKLPESVTSDSKAYVEYSWTEGTEKRTEKKLISELPTGKVGDDKVFVVENPVYAPEMENKVTYKFFDGNGKQLNMANADGTEMYKDGYQFSLRDYLDLAMANGNDDMKALADAAYDYGVASQINFKYGDYQNLKVSDKVKAVKLSDLEQYKLTESGTLPEIIKNVKYSVEFAMDNTLRVKFNFKSAPTAEQLKSLTCTIDGKAAELVKLGDTQYALVVSNIAAPQIDTAHTFTITDGKNTYTTVRSALSYAYSAIQANTNPTLTDLAKAMFLYNQAANEKFGE